MNTLNSPDLGGQFSMPEKAEISIYANKKVGGEFVESYPLLVDVAFDQKYKQGEQLCKVLKAKWNPLHEKGIIILKDQSINSPKDSKGRYKDGNGRYVFQLQFTNAKILERVLKPFSKAILLDGWSYIFEGQFKEIKFDSVIEEAIEIEQDYEVAT